MFIISPRPFAPVLVGQVVSVGTGLVDATQLLRKAPWVATLSQCSLPSEGSSQALHTLRFPTGAGLAAGKALLRRDESPELPQSGHRVLPPKRKAWCALGSIRGHGHSLSPLVSVPVIWQESWLTAGKADETIHRATDIVCCPISGGGRGKQRGAVSGEGRGEALPWPVCRAAGHTHGHAFSLSSTRGPQEALICKDQ